jgi:hypothetical protein
VVEFIDFDRKRLIVGLSTFDLTLV